MSNGHVSCVLHIFYLLWFDCGLYIKQLRHHRLQKSDFTWYLIDNEADKAILYVSQHNESFTLLKFGQILIYQNQKLQIPVFVVYNAPDV